MHFIIIIEKYLPSSIFWPNLVKDNRIAGLSVEEILNTYKGFEGELIYFHNKTKKSTKTKQALDEFKEIKELGNCILLHILTEGDRMNPLCQDKIVFVGYDVGVCDDEKTIYSSIFNEVLFGHIEELISYKDSLNDNLLFPNRTIAENYVKTHDEMSAQGKGVEDYMPMEIYEIWQQQD